MQERRKPKDPIPTSAKHELCQKHEESDHFFLSSPLLGKGHTAASIQHLRFPHTWLFSYSTPSCPLPNAHPHSMLLAKLLPQHLDVVPPHQQNPAPNPTLSITLYTALPAPATARMHKLHSQGIKLAQKSQMEMEKAGPMNNIYSSFCWTSHSSCSGSQESKAI